MKIKKSSFSSLKGKRKQINIGQPNANGTFGMPKAGRGLDALNNIYGSKE